MTITNSQSGTNVHEIAAGIYRISTPVSTIPGGFTFNQILVVDEQGRHEKAVARRQTRQIALSRIGPGRARLGDVRLHRAIHRQPDAFLRRLDRRIRRRVGR